MFKNNSNVSDVFSNITYTPSCGLTAGIDVWTAEGTINITDTTDFNPSLSIETESEVGRLSLLIEFTLNIPKEIMILKMAVKWWSMTLELTL